MVLSEWRPILPVFPKVTWGQKCTLALSALWLSERCLVGCPHKYVYPLLSLEGQSVCVDLGLGRADREAEQGRPGVGPINGQRVRRATLALRLAPRLEAKPPKPKGPRRTRRTSRTGPARKPADEELGWHGPHQVPQRQRALLANGPTSHRSAVGRAIGIVGRVEATSPGLEWGRAPGPSS